MDTQRLILERLDAVFRTLDLDDVGDIQWVDAKLIRKCTILSQRGSSLGWRDFISHFQSHRKAALGFIRIFEQLGWVQYSVDINRLKLTLPDEFAPIDSVTQNELDSFLNPNLEVEDERPTGDKPGEIMYIEEKPGLTGHARIGRVTFSATRKTIYYAGRKLQSLKGGGYKANYYNVVSGLEYWISNCKRNGNDTLYPGIVEIDEDAREEYWTTVRGMPQNAHLTSYRSEGKYSKRRP